MNQDYFQTLELMEPHFTDTVYYSSITFVTLWSYLATLSVLILKDLFQRQLPSCTSNTCYKPSSSCLFQNFPLSSGFPISILWLIPLCLCLILLINSSTAFLFSKTVPWRNIQKVNIPHLTQTVDFHRDGNFRPQLAWEERLDIFIMITYLYNCNV